MLAVRADSKERFDSFLTMVTAVADDLDVVALDSQDIEQCARAITIALRFRGPVGAQGQRIEDALLVRMLESTTVSDVVAISDLFLAHGRARGRAVDIATRLRLLSEVSEAGLREPCAKRQQTGVMWRATRAERSTRLSGSSKA